MDTRGAGLFTAVISKALTPPGAQGGRAPSPSGTTVLRDPLATVPESARSSSVLHREETVAAPGAPPGSPPPVHREVAHHPSLRDPHEAIVAAHTGGRLSATRHVHEHVLTDPMTGEEDGRFGSVMYDVRDANGNRWWQHPDHQTTSAAYDREFDRPFRHTIGYGVPASARAGAAHAIARAAGSHVVAPVTEGVDHGFGRGYAQAHVDGRTVSSMNSGELDRFVEGHQDEIQQSALWHLWLGATDSHAGNAYLTHPTQADPRGHVAEIDAEDVLPYDGEHGQFRSWAVPYAAGRRLRPGAMAMLSAMTPEVARRELAARGFDGETIRATQERIRATQELAAGGFFPSHHAEVLDRARAAMGLQPLGEHSFDWSMEPGYARGRRLLAESGETGR